ncbi:MAG: serine/threonine-protein phosphatase [Deltaproteobacteria bacterium]|nr:serine/threonine-protein phosphatase [Deltaproteobacteria bacterium]
MEYGHGTDTGRQRDNNQDSYCVCPELGLFIVADGLGAYMGGEVASAMVTDTVMEKVRSGMSVRAALQVAHEEILRGASIDESVSNMASTAVVLKLDGNGYEVSWVGDSRAYMWDSAGLRQLTCDHSYVQSLIDVGSLTKEDVKYHPKRHVMTQALGWVGAANVEVDTVSGIFCKGEKILLCSDGLTDVLEEGEMIEIIAGCGNDQHIVDALIQKANDNGGFDNITAILVSSHPRVSLGRQP